MRMTKPWEEPHSVSPLECEEPKAGRLPAYRKQYMEIRAARTSQRPEEDGLEASWDAGAGTHRSRTNRPVGRSLDLIPRVAGAS